MNILKIVCEPGKERVLLKTVEEIQHFWTSVKVKKTEDISASGALIFTIILSFFKNLSPNSSNFMGLPFQIPTAPDLTRWPYLVLRNTT